MKIYSLYLTYRNIVRLKEILLVFLKYGFFNLVENSDLKRFIPFYKRFLAKRAKKYIKGGIEVQLRMVFEELGPTFIKFGQMLSRRDDLVGRTFVEELSKLEDRATPVPFELLKDILKRHYGDISCYFKGIDKTPLASASIAQVHLATLTTGEDVVLKIKRPDIEDTIKNDLIILKFLGRFFEKHFPVLRYLKLSEIVNEFEKTTLKELNFLYEIGNMEKMAALLSDEPKIVIPKPKRELSNKDVIVMEHIKAVKLVDKEALEKVGVDMSTLLKDVLTSLVGKTFEKGVYHGDLHMGNIGVTLDGRIVLYDFGNVGLLSKATRALVRDFFKVLVTKDYEGFIDKLIELELVGDEKHLIGIEKDLAECFEYRMGLSLKQLDLAGVIKDVIEISREHRLNLPSELAGFFRTVLHIETIGKTSIPEFSLGEILSDIFKEKVFQTAGARDAVKETIKVLNDFKKTTLSFPRRLDKILNKMVNDRFTVDFYHTNLEPLTEEMKKSSNRISVSLIVAALIIGSSLVFFSDKGPHIFGYPLLGVIGFLFSAVLGVYLLFGIMRS